MVSYRASQPYSFEGKHFKVQQTCMKSSNILVYYPMVHRFYLINHTIYFFGDSVVVNRKPYHIIHIANNF